MSKWKKLRAQTIKTTVVQSDKKCWHKALPKGLANNKVLPKGGRYPRTNPTTNPRTNIQDNRGSRRSWEGQSFPVQPIWCHLRTSRLPSGGRFLWRVVRTVLWGVGELFSFSVRLDTDAFVCLFRGSVLSLMSWCNGAGKSFLNSARTEPF